MTAGQLVAQGVVEEKSSRVVELLLATVRPWQLMAGKVLGIGVIGLTQVVLVVGAGAGTALALGLVDTSSINLGVTALWVRHLVRRRLHHVRPGARCAGRAGVPAGGRRLGDRARS